MKKTAGVVENIVGLLGKGTEFDGKLAFEGTVRIDGKFKGEVFTKGALIVGENAEVHAEIEADRIIVSGEVHGNLLAASCIEIRSPGRVYGNLRTPALIVEEGVLFDGSCQMSCGEKAPVVALDSSRHKLLDSI